MRSPLVFVLASVALASEWQPIGPFGGTVLSVAADHESLLAGTRNGQLFRSTDHGQNWRQLSFGRFLNGNVHVLAIDPAAPNHYLVGIAGEDASSDGIWESHDAGLTWEHSLAGLSIESVALFPSDTSTVAAGTRQGLYLKHGPSPWTRVTPLEHAELQDIVSLAFDPTDPNVLYAGTPHLPWKTTDGGQTWTTIHTGMIDDSDVFSLHVSRADPTRVFASACSGIYRSLDAGQHWSFLDGIPRGSRRTHIIVEDTRNPDLVYAGTTMGLFRSADGGRAWSRLSTAQVNSIALDPSDPKTLYIATEHAGLHISHDRGETLEPISNGIHARNVSAIARIGSLLYAGTSYENSEGGVFLGQGPNWRRITPKGMFDTRNVRALASDGKRLYAAANSDLLQSINGGRTWTAVPKPPKDILALAFVSKELWIGTRTGLYRKSGAIWLQTKPVGAEPVLDIQTIGKRVILRGGQSVWTSADNGATWQRIEQPSLFDASLSCDGTILLASSVGLSRAANGDSPQTVQGIPEGTVSAVAFHPFDCQQAYATQFGRLYHSTDGGLHWSPAEPQASLPSVSHLWISDSDPGTLVASTPGSGIFTRPIPAD